MSLSPQEQNARMRSERSVLQNLLEAALAGDFAQLQTVVEGYQRNHLELSVYDVLSNFKDAQKRTALHFACQSQSDTTIVRDILNWVSDDADKLIVQKDKEGLTPLMLAAQHDNRIMAQQRVLYIVAEKPTSHKIGLMRSKAGATALHYAASKGATPTTLEAIYETGKVALNTFSLSGGTPLHWACAVSSNFDYSETIQALIELGANVNATTERIPPPLFMAVAAGHDVHAKQLLQYDDKITESLHHVLVPGGVTIFHMVADLNLPGVLAELINKIDYTEWIDRANENGERPLDLAAREGHTGCVMLLLAATNQDHTEQDAITYIQNYRSKHPTNGTTTDSQPAIQSSKEEPSASNKDDSPTAELEAQAKEEAARLLLERNNVTDEQKKLAEQHKVTGNVQFSKHDYTSTIESYSAAIGCDPTNAIYYSNRSAAYLESSSKSSALHDAIVAATLQPDWPKAHYRIAKAKYALERYQAAAESAWDGLKLDPSNSELTSLLQQCVKKGRNEHLKKSS